MKPSNPYKPALAALVLSLAALLLATCPNPAISGDAPAGKPVPDSADIPAGTGLAVIQLEGLDGGNAARTALPDPFKGYFFILRFTAGTKEVERMLDGITSITLPLEIGEWDLEVKAYTYTSSGTAPDRFNYKAVGNATLDIKAETTTAFTVELALNPDFSGTGTLTYDISVPSSTRGWLGLYPLDVPGFSGDIFGDPGDPDDDTLERDISSNPGGLVTVSGIPGGTYRAVIDLYDKGTNKFAAYSTVVHIYDGQTTPLKRTFTLEGNFADCPPKVTANTLTAKLDYALATEGDWTIDLDGTETDLAGFPSKTLSLGSGLKTITIRGNGRTVQSRADGIVLSAGSGSTTLVLQDVTLNGLGGSRPLVEVGKRVVLELRAGSRITGNESNINGGGVYINGGALTMIGGTVSGNRYTTYTYYAGGVSVTNNGTFTMTGGAVSGNRGINYGGGVCLNGGNVTMTGGAISGNTVGNGNGGGVFINSGTFTMTGGAVSGNTAGSGGGVYTNGGGIVTMTGGTVSGNTSIYGGGGVSINSGIVTMTGGTVSGNTGLRSEEVRVSGGTFTMSADARPARVSLNTTMAISIGGDLNGGMTMIDLVINDGFPLSDWVNKPVLQLDSSYSAGNLAALTAYFRLGNAELTSSPYTVTAIPTESGGYTIDGGGKVQAVP